jgi:hypothetical protein
MGAKEAESAAASARESARLLHEIATEHVQRLEGRPD